MGCALGGGGQTARCPLIPSHPPSLLPRSALWCRLFVIFVVCSFSIYGRSLGSIDLFRFVCCFSLQHSVRLSFTSVRSSYLCLPSCFLYTYSRSVRKPCCVLRSARPFLVQQWMFGLFGLLGLFFFFFLVCTPVSYLVSCLIFERSKRTGCSSSLHIRVSCSSGLPAPDRPKAGKTETRLREGFDFCSCIAAAAYTA